MNSCGILLLTVGALAVVATVGGTRGVRADGSPPATYDYDVNTPGTQGPTSPFVANHDYRSVRSYQVSIPVQVPMSQLQALLPAGFQALESPTDSGRATVTLGFFLDQRFERTGVGTFGPVSALLVSTTAQNNNVKPARNEILFPCFEASGEIEALNASFGPGSARLATVRVNVEERKGKIKFNFHVADKQLGLDLDAEAICSANINTRSISDPVGLPFRTYGPTTVNNAFRAASQSDALTIPVADAKLKLRTQGNKLRFPGGPLTIRSVGPTVTFNRGVEFIVKFEGLS